MAGFIIEFIEPHVDTDHERVDVKGNRGQIWQVTVDGSSGEERAG